MTMLFANTARVHGEHMMIVDMGVWTQTLNDVDKLYGVIRPRRRCYVHSRCGLSLRTQ